MIGSDLTVFNRLRKDLLISTLQHILIVDDHADTTRLFARLLRFHGYTVSEALSAGEALTLASTNTFDLLISDLNLPDLDGISLLTRLRESSPLRAIALTGYNSHEDRARVLAAGFDTFLLKPVPMDQLLLSIHSLLSPSLCPT